MKKNSKTRNTVEIHHPDEVCPEDFEIVIAVPSKPQPDRAARDRRDGAGIAKPLFRRHKK